MPYDYAYNPEQFSPHMRQLLQEELVEQVFPVEHISDTSSFEEPFLDYAEQYVLNRRILIAPPGRAALIHIEKIGRIGDRLQRMGLAHLRNYPWYEVEPHIASAFMAYLATYLGNIDSIDAAPVTTEYRDFHILAPNKTTISNLKRVAIRKIILEDVFPYPADLRDVPKLARFKRRYGIMLRSFRRSIEDSIIDLANIEDNEAREERTRSLRMSLNEEIEHITEAMKVDLGRVAFGTLVPIIASVASVIAVDLEAPPVVASAGIVAGGLSLITAAYGAITAREDQQNALRRPLAYAAFAKRYFSP